MSARPDNLNDLVLVIAGASSGFGRGAAEQLAAKGANVMLAARRKNVLDDIVLQINTVGGTAVAVEADVSDPAQVTGGKPIL
ncbi:Fatty acyl-CoA reductase [compost metagenome]|jgi:NADP-dependent 3-hydroxy acid dehydrogenase YdfG